jgi:hypothetical protein
MYITKTDFTAYTSGTVIPDAEFAELAERASDIIDRLTFDRIPLAGGLSKFDETIQAAVKKATCAQLQTLWAQGGLSTVEGFGAEANIQSVSIGKFSVSNGAGNAARVQPLATIDGVPVSPLVSGYLRRTGLLYRGIG